MSWRVFPSSRAAKCSGEKLFDVGHHPVLEIQAARLLENCGLFFANGEHLEVVSLGESWWKAFGDEESPQGAFGDIGTTALSDLIIYIGTRKNGRLFMLPQTGLSRFG